MCIRDRYHKGRYLLQFDGKESVALYDFVSDRLLEHNLLGTLPEMQSSMESELKAIIQQYMTRMNTDKLVCEYSLFVVFGELKD